MDIQNLLEKIRGPWIHRLAHDLARGAGVRENFEKELARFFNLLDQAILTGDPSWVDPVIFDWANSPTESDLAEGQYNLSTLVARANTFVFDVAKDILEPEESLELLSATSPIFSYALTKAAASSVNPPLRLMVIEPTPKWLESTICQSPLALVLIGP